MRIGRQFETGDKDAVRLIGTTSDASAELMKLGESEALGFENDHHGSVGYIDANLDDCGGHEDLCFALDKALHFGFLFGRFHLAVNLA